MIHKYPVIGIVAAALLLLIAGLLVMRKPQTAVRPESAWFYDLDSQALFAVPSATLSPTDAPSGGAGQGVQAFVYACGNCADHEQRVGYLCMVTPEAIEAARLLADPETATPALRDREKNGTLIADVPAEGDKPRWVPIVSPEGMQISGRPTQTCGDEPIEYCYPD